MNIETDSFVGKKTWGVEEKEKVMVQCSLLLVSLLKWRG